MKGQRRKRRLLHLVFFFLLPLMLSVGIFYLCYRYDNKYTVQSPQPSNGVLWLQAEDLQRYPIQYPILDWEIYRGKLLSPEDFREETIFPDELVFIGQYGGFEGRGNQRPHGSATYRLNIFVPSDVRSYTLELPEIYSAYKLYINGALVKEMGDINPESYVPETKISAVTISVGDRIEIIIAVTDYSNLYSGMVYPPSFGESQDVMNLLNFRFFLRTTVCVLAIGIGILHMISFCYSMRRTVNRKQSKMHLIFVLLCISFTLYLSYPLIKTMTTVGAGFYVIERFAYCLMLFLLFVLQHNLLRINKRWELFFLFFGGATCMFSLIFPMIMKDNLTVMMGYSQLIGFYAVICGIYLTICNIYSIYQGITKNALLCIGISVFDAALIMDRIYPLFEPIRFGWFIETASGVLIFIIGAILAIEVSAQLHQQQITEARMEGVTKIWEVQKTYFPSLLEKEQRYRIEKHDTRHHLSVIRELALGGNTERLILYLEQYEHQYASPHALVYCSHYIINVILEMYAKLAKQQNTKLRITASAPEELPIEDLDLCVIIGNLLENALEASLQEEEGQGWVSIDIGCALGQLGIYVNNNCGGRAQRQDNVFLSSKEPNRIGVGIASIQAITEKYHGTTNFHQEKQQFFSEVILPIAE